MAVCKWQQPSVICATSAICRSGNSPRHMNVPRTYISKIENGKAMPTLSSLARLAKALQVDISALLRDATTRHRDETAVLDDRPLPRRDRGLHLAARRSTALDLPESRTRAGSGTTSHGLTAAPHPTLREGALDSFTVTAPSPLLASNPLHCKASSLPCQNCHPSPQAEPLLLS